MIKRLAGHDWILLACLIILAGFGSATIASVAPEYLGSQLIFYALSFLALFFFSKIDYQIYSALVRPIYFVAVALLLFTLFLGFESHGALRWIVVGPFRLQFSEIFKPFLVIVFAYFLSSNPSRKFSRFLLVIFILVFPIFLIFKQPDLGSALVYFLGAITMIFLSDINLIYLASLIIPAIISVPIIWFFLASYQKERILTFLSPQHDPLGSSYNAIQSLITVGSGMLLGKGLGRGTQSHLLFLPERHTDFIFASIAEEFGFIGAFILIAFYFLIVWRIFSLAFKTKNKFGRLVCLGIGSLLLFQTFINIGMNIGIMPVTGITLPFVSYGGSSLLATAISLGIVQNIALSEKEESAYHIV